MQNVLFVWTVNVDAFWLRVIICALVQHVETYWLIAKMLVRYAEEVSSNAFHFTVHNRIIRDSWHVYFNIKCPK